MCKYIKYTFVIILSLFSFYYTDLIIRRVNSKDPLLNHINKVKSNYTILPVNGILSGDTIVPGINGKTVNIDKSYKAMRFGRVFREDILIYDYLFPENRLIDNNDKFIINGNNKINNVSLLYIFDINDINKLKNIDYLNIFINNNDINLDNLKKINKNNLYLYGDNGDYHNIKNINILSSISSNKNKYCLSEYKDYETLYICTNNDMYTVVPSVVGGYYDIKNNISNGSIILINSLDNIDLIKRYIIGKGFNIVTLDELFRE